MDGAQITNVAGLTVSIVGAGLIWKFGLPPDVDRHGHIHIIAEQEDEGEKAKARRFDKRNGVGFALLIFGFIIQVVSNFI